MNHTELWGKCLDIIKDNIPERSFQTWFGPIRPLKLSDKVLTIEVPSSFFYEYLEEHFIDILRKTLFKVIGEGAKLEYSIVLHNNTHNSDPYMVKMPTQNRTELKNTPVSVPMGQNEQNNIKNPFVIPGIQKLNIDPQLNREYTFDNFIEGECNRLARSAGYAIAQNPGKTTFNPLFIYGASGLGKTHLAHAIGIEVKSRFPEKTVLYVAANKLERQYTDSTRSNERNDFVHFYQMIDVLIVDDVHDFAGKKGTQDVFFHIFNHLHQSGKQLILTSDKPPVELEGLEPRLLSRFKWGLNADVQVPDFETRKAVLKNKAYKDGIELDEEIIDYIAGHINTNIREMEGALVSLMAQSTLNRKAITLDLAKSLIEKFVRHTKKEVTLDSIQQAVCNYFGMPMEQLKSKTRKRDIVQARQIAMFFAKSKTKASLSTIGSLIGGKDHATVLHAVKTVGNLKETDKRFKTYIEDISKMIEGV
ncbi:MAG: chromosomal replication initiator protein DnaA [Salinivirgaceae bacterium]